MTIHGIGMLRPEEPPVPRIRLWDCKVAWKDVNPAKGVFVWDALDAMVALGRGLLVLGATPQWAARNPEAVAAPWIGPGSSSPPRLLTDWDAYVRAVATRYRGRLDYQVWNEPQSMAFWNPIGEISRLGVMTKRAYAIIKRIDPDAHVAAAPVLPRPSSGGLKRGSRYLNALRSQGWPVDAFTLHAYPEPGEGAVRYRWMVTETMAALTALGAPKKPLWVTEVNFNLLHGPVPESRVPLLMSTTDAVSEMLGVKRVYWYAYRHPDPIVLGIPFMASSVGTHLLQTL